MRAGRGRRVPTRAGHVQAHAQSRALIDRLRFEIWDAGSRAWHEIDRSIVNVSRFGRVFVVTTVNVKKHLDLSKKSCMNVLKRRFGGRFPSVNMYGEMRALGC